MTYHPTTLLYKNIESVFSDNAIVQGVVKYQGKDAIILDQTIFYPQSNTQPCDIGVIRNNKGTFQVTNVQLHDNIVYHIGSFSHGSFSSSDRITIEVDKAQRQYHSRYHTAGDLITVAILTQSIDLKLRATHHYPEDAYNEYVGSFPENIRKDVKEKIQKAVDQIILHAHPINKVMGSSWELEALSAWVPDNLPKNIPIHAMIVEKHPALVCDGTHVENTKIVGKLTINNLQEENGIVHISYSLN